MRRPSPHHAAAVLFIAAALCLGEREVRAADPAACVDAAGRAQVERDGGQLLSALEHLVSCSNEQCPVIVRKDCAAWLSQVEARVPSITVHAVDARGADVIPVRVILDGKVVRERLDGRAIKVDPGEHHARFESAGSLPVEQTLLISEGEKSRAVLVRLEDAGAPQAAQERPATSGTDAWQVMGWGLLGLGALSLATFGIVELVAQGEYRSIRDGCGVTRSCSSNTLSSTQTKFDVAKVSVVVAAASLAVGIPLLAFRPKASTARAAVLDAVPLTTGGAVRLRGAF
jgi:hypothetical protein